jgi:hypothetical protein
MIGRADIEGSKSNVAMAAWLPQASYPCGNFSDTSAMTTPIKQRIDRPYFHNRFKEHLSPFGQLEISRLHECPVGHLRYALTGVPPQPNSPSCLVLIKNNNNEHATTSGGISMVFLLIKLPPILHLVWSTQKPN